ncbi:MAG: AI-2E family transporter [Maioricimonas sp. JB045]
MNTKTSFVPGIGLRVLLGAAAFVIVAAGMRAAASIVVPFLLATFLAVLSSPPLRWMRSRGVPDWISLILVLGVLSVLAISVATIIGVSVNTFVRDWPRTYRPRAYEISRDWNDWIDSWVKDLPMLESLRISQSGSPLGGVGSADNLMQYLTGVLGALAGMAKNVFLIVLTAIFILLEASGLPTKLRAIAPDSNHSLQQLDRIASNVTRYMAIKTGTSFMTGLLIATGLYYMGIDFFLLWGLLAFLLNYIPNIGSILASVPAILLALFQYGVGAAALTAVLYLVINVSIGNFLEPRWMGRGLGMSTLVVFLSLVFWGFVLGPVGMLISVPLTMTFKIALESAEDTRWLAILMGPEATARQEAIASR